MQNDGGNDLLRDVSQNMTSIPLRPALSGNGGSGGSVTGSGIFMGTVREIHENTLTVHIAQEVDGEEIGEVRVLKPPHLRKDVYDGVNIVYEDGTGYTAAWVDQRERTVSGGAYTETQVVNPDYWDPDLMEPNYETIFVVGLDEVVVADANNVQYQDINVAGRVWARN